MASEKPSPTSDTPSESPTTTTTTPDTAPSPASGLMQALRESLAGLISIVILVLAAYMMYQTFGFARTPPAEDKDPAVVAARQQAQKDAYDRQKDIMLYALALLGTVTGYYLGRVPAEQHAQQAQRAADNADKKLSNTQERLTDAAVKATDAASKLGKAESENARAKSQLRDAKDALQEVDGVLANAAATAGASGAESFTAGDEEILSPGAGMGGEVQATLSAARHRVRRLLDRIDVD
jgi:hypothetical protein